MANAVLNTRANPSAVPKRFVAGERQWPHFLLVADSMVRWMPNAQRVVIPGSAHGVRFAEPERFKETLLAFLRARFADCTARPAPSRSLRETNHAQRVIVQACRSARAHCCGAHHKRDAPCLTSYLCGCDAVTRHRQDASSTRKMQLRQSRDKHSHRKRGPRHGARGNRSYR